MQPTEKPQFRRASTAPRVIAEPSTPLINSKTEELFWYLLDFNGRTGVVEFLVISLIFFLIALVPGLILVLLNCYNLGLFLVKVTSILLIAPSIALQVRRLHDTGKSGLFLLIGLIPAVGGIVVLIMLLMPADESIDNPYKEKQHF